MRNVRLCGGARLCFLWVQINVRVVRTLPGSCGRCRGTSQNSSPDPRSTCPTGLPPLPTPGNHESLHHLWALSSPERGGAGVTQNAAFSDLLLSLDPPTYGSSQGRTAKPSIQQEVVQMPLLGPRAGLWWFTLRHPTGSPESLPAKGPGTTLKAARHRFPLVAPDHGSEPFRGKGVAPQCRVCPRGRRSRGGRGLCQRGVPIFSCVSTSFSICTPEGTLPTLAGTRELVMGQLRCHLLQEAHHSRMHWGPSSVPSPVGPHPRQDGLLLPPRAAGCGSAPSPSAVTVTAARPAQPTV